MPATSVCCLLLHDFMKVNITICNAIHGKRECVSLENEKVCFKSLIGGFKDWGKRRQQFIDSGLACHW